jgi:2-polyprenyl-6-hydroxyphenyl methylase/3-demethylubiquinone-9 3-methyltransferase
MNHDTTIDPREIEFYSGLADTWWDRDGPFWPLHKLNELRTAYILDKLCRHFGRDAKTDKPLDGLRVLDVGCGGGILSESMARHGAEVTGIDVVEKNIRIASLHAARQCLEIDYRTATASLLADAGETFDVVLNMEVVEHVADVDAFMRDCCRLVCDSGVMFVATINRNLLSWLFAIVGAEYVLGWLPRGTHRWSWFRTPTEIAERLAEGGLTVADTAGVYANPFNRRLAMTKRTNVNYMIFALHSQPLEQSIECRARRG